jgi:hypothetical protein
VAFQNIFAGRLCLSEQMLHGCHLQHHHWQLCMQGQPFIVGLSQPRLWVSLIFPKGCTHTDLLTIISCIMLGKEVGWNTVTILSWVPARLQNRRMLWVFHKSEGKRVKGLDVMQALRLVPLTSCSGMECTIRVLSYKVPLYAWINTGCHGRISCQ